MARRRMIVGFVEVETPQARTWRHAASGMTVDQIVAEGRRPQPQSFHDGGHTPEGRFRYFCGADKPATDSTFQVAPLYRTSKVPADAECEVCGIGIRELQADLTRALAPVPDGAEGGTERG